MAFRIYVVFKKTINVLSYRKKSSFIQVGKKVYFTSQNKEHSRELGWMRGGYILPAIKYILLSSILYKIGIQHLQGFTFWRKRLKQYENLWVQRYLKILFFIYREHNMGNNAKQSYERLLEDLSKQENRAKEDILQDALEDYCKKQSKSTIQKSLDEILEMENAQLGYLRSIAIMTKSPEIFENIKDVNEEINRLFESGKV